jgi:putative ABC transport system ATP-binding protein
MPIDPERSSDDDDAFVRLENVTRTFPMGEVDVRVLRGVTASIPRGCVTAIVGESGSGKTTLLNLIGGIDRPSDGRVIVGGTDLVKLSDRELTFFRRNRVGFVFQLYNLIATLTARENVMTAAELVADAATPDEALSLVGLDGFGDHFPGQLSGGQQQRVSIARAIAKRPELLLCDEPTGALDRETGVRILALLQTLNERQGVTIVLITHSRPIAALAHRVLSLEDGIVRSVRDSKNPKRAEELEW